MRVSATSPPARPQQVRAAEAGSLVTAFDSEIVIDVEVVDEDAPVLAASDGPFTWRQAVRAYALDGRGARRPQLDAHA
jgi:hypothetical protein